MKHLVRLESEAIFIVREAFRQSKKQVLLFSGGKDSVVLSQIALRAFWPNPVPFTFLHIDTGFNFPELLQFRDRYVSSYNFDLHVVSVEETMASHNILSDSEKPELRNGFQSLTLRESIGKFQWDAVLGGARRDEEMSRAKERIFSYRSAHGVWEPDQQRPELWNIYQGRVQSGEHFRIFPLSNWSEEDIWEYICWRQIPLCSLYYSHQRPIFYRSGIGLANLDPLKPQIGELAKTERVRFRTLGDIPCSGLVVSEAATSEDVLREVFQSQVSERASRFDDRLQEASMEIRKSQGYF